MPHSNAWKAAWARPAPEHAKPTRWGWTVYYPDLLQIGDFVDIGWGTFINAHYGVTLESNVEIGPLCAIISDSSIDGSAGLVIVEKGARIGAHCTVMPGVVIGKGAVVGAHSFVKDRIPPGALAFGVPARVKIK